MFVFFIEKRKQNLGGVPKIYGWPIRPHLGVAAPPPRLSQNLAGLLGKKQIHLGGGSLSAGIQVLRWESLVSIMSKQGTIKTKRKERFLFFIAKRVCLLQNVSIFLFVKTFY